MDTIKENVTRIIKSCEDDQGRLVRSKLFNRIETLISPKDNIAESKAIVSNLEEVIEFRKMFVNYNGVNNYIYKSDTVKYILALEGMKKVVSILESTKTILLT